MTEALDAALVAVRAEADALSATLDVPVGSPLFAGHFPNRPVLPGVTQLAFLDRCARRAFADFPAVVTFRKLKFSCIVAPGMPLSLAVTRRSAARFAFSFASSETMVASGLVEPTSPATLVPESLPDVATLLPHRAPMILLASCAAVFPEGGAMAYADVSERCPYYDAARGGVPGFVALEYMAQTVALCAGASARARDCQPEIGYVLGARKLVTSIAAFAPGMRYRVTAQHVYDDGGFAAFACAITDAAGRVVASGTLSAYRPDVAGTKGVVCV